MKFDARKNRSMNKLVEYMKHLEDLREESDAARGINSNEKKNSQDPDNKKKKKKKQSKKEHRQDQNPWNLKWMIE